MEAEYAKKIEEFLAANKGKRKFVQSIELIINFKGIDFTKVENRLNLAIPLPYGRGKNTVVAVFADDPEIISKVQKLNGKVISSKELPEYASNASLQRQLLNYELLAQPSFMPQIAKSLGQFLGPRNKMPRPITGDIAALIEEISKSVYLRNKGKYLPTLQCLIGIETMPAEQIIANADAVLNAIKKKINKQNIKSVYIKATMSDVLRL
ncbi:MAG: hypothetical protein QXD11_02190 [Candidatus Micrarchaeaceae archaeon]